MTNNQGRFRGKQSVFYRNPIQTKGLVEYVWLGPVSCETTTLAGVAKRCDRNNVLTGD